ncbi:MAG: ABC transporter ATP-binding protein [Acidobacteriota bacterium]
MKSIEVKNISYTYPDGIEVFRNISYSVSGGESFGIVGPNGAGKTTMLLALSGLIDIAGDIIIEENKINKKNIREIRKKISYVFQNPDDQLFMPTVFEDISFGLEKLGYSDEQIRTEVERSLEMVSLEGFEERSSHHLSLGQKKRVNLASAFARNSGILLLDEPTNELDPKGRRDFIELIQKFKGTKVIVSHDLNMIAELCNKVMILNNKKIESMGETKKILSNKKLMEENSLEVPCILK